MSVVIEKDEGTAARRRVPVRLFTSDGTTPDTGALNDAMILGVNSLTTISTSSTLREVHAAQGMYALELTQSECSVLGEHPLYHTVGAFPHHVANVRIVNSNIYSTESHGNYLKPTTAGRTLDVTAAGTAGVDWGNVENQATENDLSLTTIRGADLLVSNLDKTAYDLNADQTAVSVGTVSNLGNHSVGTVTNVADKEDYFLDPQGSGKSTLADLNDNDGSEVTIHSGGIASTAFAAGAVDAAALATDAVNEIADGLLDRNMATGADSGSSAVRTPRDALRALRNRVASDATQIYVYEEDDTTIKWRASITTVPSTNAHISGADPNA